MSGIIAVYALVISVLIASGIKPPPATYSLYAGFMHMAAGLSVGLSGLAAGYAIGIVGDAVGSVARATPIQTDSNRAFALSCASRASLWAWSSFSFSQKSWVSTGKFLSTLNCVAG